MKSPKEYQNLDELIQRMHELRLDVGDREHARLALTKQSYHRLGGYRYVFRELLPGDQQDIPSRTFRHDHFVPGSTLTDVVALADFDNKLRTVVMEGTLHFEVALRNCLTELLARRHPVAHRMVEHLDAQACARQHGRPAAAYGVPPTKLEKWIASCDKSESDASGEDFIAHFRERYKGFELPVWATLEVVNFGSLAFLLGIMRMEDRLEAAKGFGFKHQQPFTAGVWQLVDLRNQCAHGARLYNRVMKRSVGLEMKGAPPDNLRHLADLDESAGHKLYPVAAILASALRHMDPSHQWPSTFATQVKKLYKLSFPPCVVQTPESNMGFPDGWADLALWRHAS